MPTEDDLKAIRVLQSCWVKCGKARGVLKLLHAIKYLHNRESYEKNKEKMQDLATARRNSSTGKLEASFAKSTIYG